jgi:hypothetical protein
VGSEANGPVSLEANVTVSSAIGVSEGKMTEEKLYIPLSDALLPTQHVDLVTVREADAAEEERANCLC